MEGKSIWYYIGIPLLIIAFIFKLASRLFKDKLGNFPLFQYVGGIFLIVIGFFIIIAIYEQYDYFVEDYKYRFFKKIFRETGVKIFYYLLGALIITMGFFVLSNCFFNKILKLLNKNFIYLKKIRLIMILEILNIG